jgi:hypothetical protein
MFVGPTFLIYKTSLETVPPLGYEEQKLHSV